MDPAGPTIAWTDEEQLLSRALALREEVFCGEQGVPRELELDGLDSAARHLVAVDPSAGEVVGTLRLLRAGETAKVGRVAVRRSWRRRGIASRMLEMAVSQARAEGCTRARLAAQMQATEVYAGAGFAVESEPFQEAGIEHVWMGRRLDPGTPD
ncbi:MAG TPA: GNAT family N-acetyltransferase [Solirubrobacteraceae bacterium]|nr:GNAT family N-acetyltransferase [Solirubrobacteraceae bacterium]